MTSKRRYFSGSSLEQALLQAGRHFDLNPSEVAFREVVKRHGFVKIRKRVVIEVDPESPARSLGDPHGPPLEETPPPPPVVEAEPAGAHHAEPGEAPQRVASRGRDGRGGAHDAPPRGGQRPRGAQVRERPPQRRHDPEAARRRDGEAGVGGRERLSAAAGEALEQLLDFAALDLEATVRPGEEPDQPIEISLDGPDSERILEDDGRLLLALQYLVPRLARGLVGESFPCRLDCGGFHERREEELRALAEQTAEEVRRHGRPRTLRPMAPDERRIIHLTLEEVPDVETVSEGEGYFKRVSVRPR